MCVNNPAPITSSADMRGVGTKDFQVVGNKLYGEYSMVAGVDYGKDSNGNPVDAGKPHNAKLRPINRWLKASDFQGETHHWRSPLRGHRPGWCIYRTERRWWGTNLRTLRVKYRKAHTAGENGPCGSVIVADEMLILPNQL